MNALTPGRLLRVAEEVPSGTDQVAVLGRDIRTSPERIAHYCVMAHEPVYEDLATLVESMAYWDRLVVRRRANGWARQLPIQIPVYEYGQLQRADAVKALADAAWFLTGDRWSFEFVARKGPIPARQGNLGFPQTKIRHVIPFSDGLDSFAQVQLSLGENGREAVLLVRSGLARDRIFPGLISLRVPRKFSGVRMRELSYRTRPLVFYTLAAIAASITNAEAVVIGENGQGSFGPACLPFADEWWFRSAHPAFVERWARFLGLILRKPVPFKQPQVWKTKGEVLCNLRDQGLMAGWDRTCSCATRPRERHGHRACGVCGGCLLRAIAIREAGYPLHAGDFAFDLDGREDVVRDRRGVEKRMTLGERAVAVRGFAAMAGFAHLTDSPEGRVTIERESRLVDSGNAQEVHAKFIRLLGQHRAEWEGFVNRLPVRSWSRDILCQL